MNIQSHLFVLVYLPAVVLLWRLLNRGTGRGARVFLLCAGLRFCGGGSPWSLRVRGGGGGASFLLGRGMARPAAPRRLLLAVGAALLLAVLAFFKYTGFLLSLTPLEGLFSPPAGLMPLGLSFLTFQQLFWLRDCYFGEAGRESALDFTCCLTFFATATCGPITRVGELAPQLRRPRALDWGDLAAGLYCFALGLAKKVLVASVFAQRADFGYANAGALTGVDSALTILCYTLQIYFDFSGYCDMAAGMARMMGIDLPVNFNSPYRSLSVQEFWGRWHITLSRFFRSCLYIPLGGSRRGMAVTCRNIMIVFLLSGLWHGAGWGFVLWGGLHGAALVAQRLWGRRKFLPKPLCWLLTFAFVNVAWVFFRAESLGQAGALLGDLFTGGLALPSAEFAAALSQQQLAQLLPALEGMLGPAGELLLYWLPLLAIPAGLALLACPNPLAQAERMRPTAARAVLTVACLVVSLVFFSGVDTFIYANF